MNLMPFQDQPFNGDTFICDEFLRIKDQYNINLAIETGSCMYSTTSWLADNFNIVYTVEVNQEYANYGKHKISHKFNTHPTISDSVTYLERLLPQLINKTDNCIYFLDAHWGDHCPLLEEMNAICHIQTEQPPVITIHDFYTGTEELGYDSYNGQRFDLSFIDSAIKKLEMAFGCNYNAHFNKVDQSEGAKRGIVYLTPKIK